MAKSSIRSKNQAAKRVDALVLCWFEQKAVCILIALLALGIRNIRLGPTLPPFLSPVVVAALQQKYDLKAVTTPENDLQAILGRH